MNTLKNKTTISILVIVIVIASLIATLVGLFSGNGPGQHTVQSIYGETVTLHGKGLYQHDSVSVAAQALGQDAVTLFLGIPLLIFALFLFRRGSVRGHLLLTGTLGYFLYTYTSYSFLSMYNYLFLINVLLMSASFFSFTLAMMSISPDQLRLHFGPKLPVKLLGSFMIFISIAITLMWLGRIVPSLLNKSVPFGLEHYTTLCIQALDLGFIAPIAFLTGILIIRKRPFGYLLSSVVIVKGITLLTAISVMIFMQARAGVKVHLIEVLLFPIFNLLTIFFLISLLRNVSTKTVDVCR